MPINTRPVSLLTTADRVEIFVRGEPFATYRYRESDTPGFTALYAQGERAVTQLAANGLALWMMHGNVNGVAYGVPGVPIGQSVGQIITEDMMARRGSLSVGFQHDCVWLNEAGERALTDRRTVRVLPGPSEGTILDIEIRLQAPDDAPVTFGQTEDSLLCVRAASALYSDAPLTMGGGQVRNSLGEYGAESLHGRQARWCACVGVVRGETVGFAFLEHPRNDGFPSPWVARPDGVLSPTPFEWRSRTLPTGHSLTLRYRLLVHVGYVNQGWADARQSDFAGESQP
jgi:hypothetical protein